MIIADNLSKAYPKRDGTLEFAVDALTFRVGPGQIYGLLGPNGAGKTTTLRMLSGLLSPTGGTAIIAGHDVLNQPMAVKAVIGFLTAQTGLYQRLTARDVLVYFARLNGLDAQTASRRATQLIESLGLHNFADQRCGSLSTGQRQRTNIARALVSNPPVLILDEPTLGLDVLSNRVILDFIKQQRDIGKTIMLSTHYLDEAEAMCDVIGLLHNGKLIAEGTLESLQRQTGEQRLTSIYLGLVQGPEINVDQSITGSA